MMRSLLKEQLEEGQKHFYGVMMMIRHDSTLLTLIFVQFFKGFIFHMFSYFQFFKIQTLFNFDRLLFFSLQTNT